MRGGEAKSSELKPETAKFKQWGGPDSAYMVRVPYIGNSKIHCNSHDLHR